MKIALVKQDVYQDLYVCANRTTSSKMLESTIMRVGPLGLFTLYAGDFIIVKEEKIRECQAYRKSYRPPRETIRQLKYAPINKISGPTFDYLAPRSDKSHKDFAVDSGDIDWGIYDVVISVNIAVPQRIVKRFPEVLWCYMMGEASRQSPYVEFGYDVRLSQNINGTVADVLGEVDFPYTFLGPFCLERMAMEFGGTNARKTGVYAEINTTQERPVAKVGQLEFVRALGHEVVVHDQDIVANVVKLRNSKYFVKLGGRRIRGNSVIEAISAGTLVLMDPKDLLCSQLLPKKTWIHSKEELSELIRMLDKDDSLYAEFLDEQRERLSFFVNDAPMESLKNCLELKRRGEKPNSSSLISIIREIRRNYF